MEECGIEQKQDQLVAKTGVSSIVWMWFGYEKADSEKKNVLLAHNLSKPTF